MFPVMIFYALTYIIQGMLQSSGKFNMSAFVSVPSSVILILYVIFLGDKYGVKGLLIATVIGLSAQALILIPPLYSTGYRYRFSFQVRDSDIKTAFKLIPPVLIATSAYQINMFFNTTVSANFKDAVALIIMVQNLILYAILALINSITSVIFPRLTVLAASKDINEFKKVLLNVLKTITFFLIPATAGFIAIRYELIDLLYGWGRFTGDNVVFSSKLLALYAIGILGVGIKEVVDKAFYSLKDTKTPAITGVLVVVINITASLILVGSIGVLGIPTAYSISALCGGIINLILIKKKLINVDLKELGSFIIKVSISSIIMFLVLIPILNSGNLYNIEYELINKGLKLFIPILAGCITYYLCTYLLKVETTIELSNKIKSRFRRY